MQGGGQGCVKPWVVIELGDQKASDGQMVEKEARDNKRHRGYSLKGLGRACLFAIQEYLRY